MIEHMKVSDLVTRKSHNNDIIFQIVDIVDDVYYLKGVDYRLIADSRLEDLNPYDKDISLQLPYINVSPHVAPGKVLHIDGDRAYVKKSYEAYQKYGINAKCLYMEENMMPSTISSLLMQDKYDVLVVTGHDFYKIDNKQEKDDLTRYQNSINFVGAVQQARRLFPDLDSLVIVAGACQSNYEALIMNGANFASSPTRDNIHMLDPIIVAAIIATSSVKDYVAPEMVVGKTISKALGGIETKGKARLHYSGANENGIHSQGIRKN